MTEKRKNRLIEIAKTLQIPKNRKHLHVTFILDKNKLLITDVNCLDKIHPYHKFGKYVPRNNCSSYIPGIHSEVSAIRQFINKFNHSDFTGLTLFNVRVDVNGHVMLSKPCNNCQRVLDSFNFKRILYT